MSFLLKMINIMVTQSAQRTSETETAFWNQNAKFWNTNGIPKLKPQILKRKRRSEVPISD